MERNIPHIKSIFSNSSSRKKSTSDTQDLCQYDKSPRSRRRNKDPPIDYYDKNENVKNTSSPKKSTTLDVGKENLKSKEEPRKNGNRNNLDLGKENLKSNDEPRKGGNRNGNYNTYTSKTLTERDMKHLERHLSMKKTIRKQISRNLAQAFIENPDIFEPEDYKQDKHKNDHKLPPMSTQQKTMKSSEQNVLDLLKISIEDRDSGHSSPTHEVLDDTDYDDEEVDDVKTWRSHMKHRDSDTKGLVEDRPKHQEPEKKSSSIWKMFSSRNKSKR